MLALSIGYILLGLLLWLLERVRTLGYGPDFFTFFLILVTIQLVFPGAILTAVIGFSSQELYTGVSFYDRVLNDVRVDEASIAFLLLSLFLLSTFLTWLLMHSLINMQKKYEPIMRTRVSPSRWLFIMLLGLIGSSILLTELGGLNNIALFRVDRTNLKSNFLTSNLFSLTMTFMVLSVVGVLLYWKKKISVNFFFSAGLVIVFCLITVSRRAFGIAVLLIYFTLILEKRQIFVSKALIAFVLIFFPVIVYGKRMLWLLGNKMDITFSGLSAASEDIYSGLILFVSNIGTSNIESWATLLYLDLPYRFGIDHLLSVLRRIPDGLMGLNIEFPERIVRISTQAFVGPYEQDIPPGLMGQMWLDFGFFGPIIWGVSFCLIISILQLLYNRIETDIGTKSIFVIWLFNICLPINSGTWDFVFSVDIFFITIFSIFIIRFYRNRIIFQSDL